MAAPTNAAKPKAGDVADRLPPQDLEAERSVLGSLMVASETIDDVLPVVQSRHFYSENHQKVFAVIHEMYEAGIRGIDAVTLGHELARRGYLEQIGGPAYLVQLLEAVPHAAHAVYYANIVRDRWLQRQLIEACTESLREVYHSGDETDDVLSRAEQRVFAILEDQAGTNRMAIADILQDTFNRIFERMDQEGTLSGLHTGFHGLDDKISGFQASELLILAARPSMGKTALVCNFALAAAQQNNAVLLFSLEQSRLELAERLLCICGKIDGHRLRQGALEEAEQFHLMEARTELQSMPIFIDDTAGRTMSQVAAVARRLKRRHDLKIVIIDYLQLIESEEKNVSREQQISTITRRLKFLAKDLAIPVIALAQLNRAVEQREDKRPRLADLRESGAIEQDADVVMFLHRPDAYDPSDRPGEADLIVAKNRSGPVGTVPLTWLKEMLKFGDRAAVHTADF